ncbi:P-II family nitrogen regulator [Iocasia frigidifontis]|uniref:P-II family nitrogen regulator n=1 Tax=Iocasia fonsfrigidae TaxID=2682810 RepID=A0A8A7KEW8_9FIRM|nr:P-II family nitrogen regulator [Iocasia fonsfrigidae]QTL97447.1 P-II family nitrogen regulator [Iocasia fonsfrigidae]
MKYMIAIIRPEKLEKVRQALKKVGCSGLMVSEIEGHGKQKGIVQQWRGEKFQLEMIPKIKLEIMMMDEDLDTIKRAITDNAHTGEIGDGKIFVVDLANAIRIRTGEEGEIAL